jgi:hypothetical protein
MLADLTDKNPNVYYELGLAHAARKPVLLLTQDIEDVPFDLRGLRVITYAVQDPRWGEVLRLAITQGLLETLKSPGKAVLPTFLQEDPERQPGIAANEIDLLDPQQDLNSLRAVVRTMQAERNPRIVADEMGLLNRQLDSPGESVPGVPSDAAHLHLIVEQN